MSLEARTVTPEDAALSSGEAGAAVASASAGPRMMGAGCNLVTAARNNW